jgi:hypothetical protein
MIVYALRCGEGHAFEGWFASGAAFDAQLVEGKLVCPMCPSRAIEKAPMAPSLSSAVGQQKSAPPAEELRKMRQFMTGLRKHVMESAENVGSSFPEEARKIHYGEVEPRPIYGEATVKEAVELVEEGVEVAPLPPDVDEAN